MKKTVTIFLQVLSFVASAGSISFPDNPRVQYNYPNSWDKMNRRHYVSTILGYEPVTRFREGGFVKFNIHLSYNFDYYFDGFNIDYQKKYEYWRNHNISWEWFRSDRANNGRDFFFKDKNGSLKSVVNVPVEIQNKVQPLCVTISASLEASDKDLFNEDLRAKMFYRFPLLSKKANTFSIISPEKLHEDQVFYENDFWDFSKGKIKEHAKRIEISKHLPSYRLANAYIQFNSFEILDIQFDLTEVIKWYYRNKSSGTSSLERQLLWDIESTMDNFFRITTGSDNETSRFMSKLKSTMPAQGSVEKLKFLNSRYSKILGKIRNLSNGEKYTNEIRKKLHKLYLSSLKNVLSESELASKTEAMDDGRVEISREQEKVRQLKASNCGFQGRQDVNDLYDTSLQGSYSTSGYDKDMTIKLYPEPRVPSNIGEVTITNLRTGESRLFRRSENDRRAGRITAETNWEEYYDSESLYELSFDGMYQPTRFRLSK